LGEGVRQPGVVLQHDGETTNQWRKPSGASTMQEEEMKTTVPHDNNIKKLHSKNTTMVKRSEGRSLRSV